ncbi:hypothetical protein ACHAXN_011940 [Cyclotella atomus]|jgi:hypothetical protein
MKFTVPTSNPRLTAKAITSIDNFEEIESMLPTAQEMMDDLSERSDSTEDERTFHRKGSMDNLKELLMMLERDSIDNKSASLKS